MIRKIKITQTQFMKNNPKKFIVSLIPHTRKINAAMTMTRHLHIYSFKFQRLNYNERISFKSQDIWRDRSFSGVQFHISLIRK